MSIIADIVFCNLGYPYKKDGDIKVVFDNQAVGFVIRKIRKEKGMTQEFLSGFAGIARTHLTMIEKGTKQPNFETVWKIALALGLTPSELVAQIEQECAVQEKK